MNETVDFAETPPSAAEQREILPGPKAVRKVAFVGQPEYFRCMYESDLDQDYEVREFWLGWEKGISHYLPLIKYDPDVTFFFRPELHPAQLLELLTGIKVAFFSEPIPKHVMGHGLSSTDMAERFESLRGAATASIFSFTMTMPRCVS